MKLRNPFRDRFIATMIAEESHREYPISFATFRQREQGEAWVEKLNAKSAWAKGLIRWELREIV